MIETMEKFTIILSLISAAVIFTGCSSNGSIDSQYESSDDPKDTTLSQPEENETEIYSYLSPNYTVSDGILTAAKTASDKSEQVFSSAMLDNPITDGDFAVEVTLTCDSPDSSAGILFRGSVSNLYDGVQGYAFMLRDSYVYLYEMDGSQYSGITATEISSDVIEKVNPGDSVRLRIECEGKIFRMYVLDDADGVEPWPEIEYSCHVYRGTGIGVIDNGHGAVFSDFTVTEYTPPASDSPVYSNPISSVLQVADPYILCHDGKYYCYATSAPLGYYVYVSDDMVNWENAGLCIEEAWGIKKKDFYWAPEVIEHNGKFYMIMTVDERIGFAVADSPLGPFIPEETWLFNASIDGHVFIDDDGQAYLYYVSWRHGIYGIYGCELEDDLVTARPETEKLLITPESPWEMRDYSAVTEGPFILKHNGLYYLTYSGTSYTSHHYAVGYATSDSPLGDYERYEANPILSKTSRLYGPGHHSFTYSESGELFMVYHVHASDKTVHPRKICIDRARFAPTESGVDRLEIFGPTHTKQEYPK